MGLEGRQPKQVNQYDKVLKENIEVILPGIMKHVVGVEPETVEGLPDGVQHTRERRPDVLRKVTDRKGNTFILQIEFQTRNDPEMVCRMAEYHIVLWRKYKLPAKQYVIYISEGKLDMPEELSLENFYFRYHLLSLLSVDYRLFLESPRPEEKMMALLGDFGSQDSAEVTNEIARQVIGATEGSLNRQRYLQQMRILAKLRKLVSLNSSNMLWGEITRYILEETDITTDPLYQKGEELGKAEKSREVVKKLLALKMFEDKEIANLAGVPEAFILEVKTNLKRRKKSR
ncbi:hypothetical protein EDB95_4628 [Dinghuibacter silviterrae]|uniref:Uncharacterized protein n=2 Tax=Dinghuibacter silviterrae TaxID=1539049 RepID=A0A4V3GKS7_9BACT|nr:hypothetical protein EDB95_4628 [Dinghuibacter silviterrae]